MPMYFFASSYYSYIYNYLNYLVFACLFHIHFHYLHMHNLLHKEVQYIQSILLFFLLYHCNQLHHYISFQFVFLFHLYKMQVYLFLYYNLLLLYSMYVYLLNFLMFHLVYLLDMLLLFYFVHHNMLLLYLPHDKLPNDSLLTSFTLFPNTPIILHNSLLNNT